MRYTLFLYNNEAAFANVSEEDMAAELAVYGQYTQALKDAGAYVEGDWLQPSMNATMLSLKDGQRQVQDGPYADTKEQLGGFYVIRAENLEAALAWAEKCPAAKFGKIEVRPSAFPEDQSA